jgi:hypothetical protein
METHENKNENLANSTARKKTAPHLEKSIWIVTHFYPICLVGLKNQRFELNNPEVIFKCLYCIVKAY